MLKHLRMLMSILSFMAFTTDPGGDPNDPPVPDPDPKDPPKPTDLPADKSTWTVEQWEAENRRIAAKEKAEGRKAAEREYQQKQEEEKQQAELAKQESEGKYEEAKQKLTSDLESAQTARDKALELLKASVDAQWDELPEAVRNTFKGEEEDVLAKSAFVQQMKPIIDELAKNSETPKPPRGNHGNPPPGDPDPDTPAPLTPRTAF